MTKNMGITDRGIRILLAIGVAVLILNGVISDLTAIILGIIALIFVVTSLIGFCPIYAPFRLSTRKEG